MALVVFLSLLIGCPPSDDPLAADDDDAVDDDGTDDDDTADPDDDSASASEDGFPMDPVVFEEACSPAIVFHNETADGNGALFDELVEDPVPLMHGVTTQVCALLYRDPAEVPVKTEITLTIDDLDGIAGTVNTGSTAEIRLSSLYLVDFEASGGDLFAEISGILHHEVTHVYQLSEDYSTNWAAIEGVADAVRYFAGYIDPANQQADGSWTSGYQTTAFFLVWLEDGYPWFLHGFNQTFDPTDAEPWTWDVLEQLTDRTVEELWQEYQDVISS